MQRLYTTVCTHIMENQPSKRRNTLTNGKHVHAHMSKAHVPPQLAAEVVYLEALVSVVRGNPVPDPRPLESTVINWMLRHQEFVPIVTDPEVKRLRDLVLDLSAQLWGLVSVNHLQHVQRRFLEELRVCV